MPSCRSPRLRAHLAGAPLLAAFLLALLASTTPSTLLAEEAEDDPDPVEGEAQDDGDGDAEADDERPEARRRDDDDRRRRRVRRRRSDDDDRRRRRVRRRRSDDDDRRRRRVRRRRSDDDDRRRSSEDRPRRGLLPPPRPRVVETEEGLRAQSGRPAPPEGTHWVVGARGGFVSVPSGLLHVFVDGGMDTTGAAVGAWFGWQRNSVEISGSVWWADYRYDEEVIFQTAGDRNDPEFVRNDLSLLTIGVDFLWSHWFTRWLSATYGFGLGLGVVLGEVRRTEATPPTGPYASIDEQPREGYVHCRYDPADPSWSTPFCEPMCSAESLADGSCPPRAAPSESGDLLGYYDTVEDRIPAVLPWINLLIGLRLLPHEHFQIDIQTGFGFGVMFLVRAAYRF